MDIEINSFNVNEFIFNKFNNLFMFAVILILIIFIQAILIMFNILYHKYIYNLCNRDTNQHAYL